ncbi:MAG: DNA alkylation repair protein [Bacteroidota bacterium]
MTDYINALSLEFERAGNPNIAAQQKAYMRHQFEFYGIKAAERRAIQKPFLIKQYLPDKAELDDLVTTLWQKPQREYQLFAQELVYRYHKQFEQKDMELMEYMVTHKSWWDTVDFIAYRLMGQYFQRYPNSKKTYAKKWMKSNNIWLQRSALLFQLKYKEDLDTELLSWCIQQLLGSKEFFINKAIGWVLREYSRTDQEWVIDFVNKTELSNLSKREALKLLNQ